MLMKANAVFYDRFVYISFLLFFFLNNMLKLNALTGQKVVFMLFLFYFKHIKTPILTGDSVHIY